MSDDTHYDVLGVAPGASKDAIKAAYQERLQDAQQAQARESASKRPNDAALGSARAEEASVRAAWQVLSDPYQRGRYDASIDVPATEHPDTGGGDVDVLDDDDDNGVANGARPVSPRAKTAADRRAARAEAMANRPPGMLSPERPKKPASWPSEVQPPPNRARTLAMGVDLVVLGLLFLVSSFLTPVLVDQMYPKESKRLDVLQTQIDKAQVQKDKADACVFPSKGNAKPCSIRLPLEKHKSGRLQPEATTLATKKDANNASKDLQTAIDKATEQHDSTQRDTSPAALVAGLGMVIAALLYLVPMSVRTGRTFGKKQFQIHMVMLNGDPITVRAALARFGTPLLFALLLSQFLGGLSFAFALFGVLTWPRNANLQGLHDRIAGTIVVDG